MPIEGLIVVRDDRGNAPRMGGLDPLLRHALSLAAAGATRIWVLGPGRVPEDARLSVPVEYAAAQGPLLDALAERAPSATVVTIASDSTLHRLLPKRLASLAEAEASAVLCVREPAAARVAAVAAPVSSTAHAVSLLTGGDSSTQAEGAARQVELLPGEFVLPTATPEERRHAETAHLLSLRKATGGYFERWYMRPLSMHLTRALMNSPVTPNQMTAVTFAIALASAYLVSTEDRALQVAGGLLHMWMRVVDCVDGELARLRYQGSRFGEWFDSVCDGIGLAALVGAAAYRASTDAPWVGPVGVVGVVGWLLVQTLQYRAAALTGGSGNFQSIEWGHRAKERSAFERFVGRIELLLRIDAISTYYGVLVILDAYVPLVTAHTAISLVALLYFSAQVLKLRRRRVQTA